MENDGSKLFALVEGEDPMIGQQMFLAFKVQPRCFIL